MEDVVRTKDSDSGLLADFQHDDFFLPSVDLLTPQDLLSFELLDINIVQELEKVPNNTPVDLTPCMSPLPHDTSTPDRGVGSQVKEDAEVTGVRRLFGMKLRAPREVTEPAAADEEREDEISGAQFLCETVIRSLALEEEPDHRPVRRAQRDTRITLEVQAAPPGPNVCCERTAEAEQKQDGSGEASSSQLVQDERSRPAGSQHAPGEPRPGEEATARGDDWDEVSSQCSSSSSCEDYIIILPDCFDTSRPLGESMYSSALSQPDAAAVEPDEEQENEEEPRDSESREEAQREEAQQVEPLTWPPPASPVHGSVTHMLCASQTLDAVTLTPEVVPPPTLPRPLLPPPALPRPLMPRPLMPPPTLYSPRSEALYLAEDPSPPVCEPYEPHEPRVHLNISSGLSRSAGSASSAFETYNPRPSTALQASRGQGGITEGLVKGALSVAASAYKALFTGPNVSIQRGVDPAAQQDPSLMAMLLEMGFRDQRLNQQLLRKHGYSLLHTVNELVQMAEDGQNQRERQNQSQNPAVDALH